MNNTFFEKLFNRLNRDIDQISNFMFQTYTYLIKYFAILTITCIISLTVIISQIISGVQNFEFDKAHAEGVIEFIREIERPYVCYMNPDYVIFIEDTLDCARVIKERRELYKINGYAS